MAEKSLGHLAHDAYKASLRRENVGGYLPEWEHVSGASQRAWNDAVEAIYQRVQAMAAPDWDETPRRDGIPLIDQPPRIGVDFHNGEQPASVYKLPPPDDKAGEFGITIYVRSDLAEPDDDETPSGGTVREPEHKTRQELINQWRTDLLESLRNLSGQKFKTGDLVRLIQPKGYRDRRGPMFVVAVRAETTEQLETARCEWIDYQGNFERETFPTAALEHVTYVERVA